jgi:hypothetical protein
MGNRGLMVCQASAYEKEWLSSRVSRMCRGTRLQLNGIDIVAVDEPRN